MFSITSPFLSALGISFFDTLLKLQKNQLGKPRYLLHELARPMRLEKVLT
jgi:hypothetical protein